jgi:hypothetical protein
MDVRVLVDVMMPRFTRDSAARLAGEPVEDWNKDEINEELARLHQPDEILR